MILRFLSHTIHSLSATCKGGRYYRPHESILSHEVPADERQRLSVPPFPRDRDTAPAPHRPQARPARNGSAALHSGNWMAELQPGVFAYAIERGPAPRLLRSLDCNEKEMCNATTRRAVWVRASAKLPRRANDSPHAATVACHPGSRSRFSFATSMSACRVGSGIR
jgi:hypothetical protein